MAPAAPPPTGAPVLTPPDSLAASDSDSNATGAETVHPPQPTPPKGLDRATLREHVRPAHPHESRRQHGHSKDDPKAPRGKKSDDTQF
jgi:hypothetical protein